MEPDLNHVVLTGSLERDPVARFADHGMQHVSFRLRVCEIGPTGQIFTLFVPVEAYSQVAELVGDLHAGASVLISGKLKWISWSDKSGAKRTTLAVLARLVKRLAPVAAAATV